MEINQKFNSYNQIIKEFDVYIMQVGKDQYQFKLIKRLDGDKPPRHPTKHRKSKFDILIERIDKIDQRLDKLENLVVTQFKAHGWIK